MGTLIVWVVWPAEGERAGSRGIVAACGGGAIGSRIVHGHRKAEAGVRVTVKGILVWPLLPSSLRDAADNAQAARRWNHGDGQGVRGALRAPAAGIAPVVR